MQSVVRLTPAIMRSGNSVKNLSCTGFVGHIQLSKNIISDY